MTFTPLAPKTLSTSPAPTLEPEGAVLGDPLEAVAAYLKEQMGETVNGNVLRPELPESLDPAMPTAAIVLMPAGGGKLMGANRLPVFDPMMDILCYGPTRQDADDIAREAEYVLREMQMVFIRGLWLYWARIASGMMPRVEPEVLWPYTEFTIQVLATQLL